MYNYAPHYIRVLTLVLCQDIAKRLMKKLIFYISTLLIFISFPVLAEKFSGFVSIEKNQLYLVMKNAKESSSNRFLIHSLNQETQNSLSKLRDRDLITGVGTFTKDNSILVEGIDFVGLRQLLGVWVSDAAWVNFKDFTTVNVYYQDEGTQKSQLEYSVTTGSVDTNYDWTIFFAGDNNVIVAGLILNKQKATFQFFDAETGQTTKKIELTKLSSYR